MPKPHRWIAAWLNRPQVTNKDALGVGLVGAVLAVPVIYGLGKALDATKLITFSSSVPVWVAAAAFGVALAAGLMLGSRTGSRLEERTGQVEAFTVYTEHIRDALADLGKVISGELPVFSLRDFIEGGLFEPAQRLLERAGTRGEVRFSVLHQDGDDWVMASPTGDLFPALGHSLAGRQHYRLPVAGSFSALAYYSGRVYASGKLSEDDRFEPHPKALPGREYESIVSLPLRIGSDIDGVLNAIATKEDAFSSVERTYITLLGAVCDIARAVQAKTERAGQVSGSAPTPELPPPRSTE